jgi:hypothetical protein
MSNKLLKTEENRKDDKIMNVLKTVINFRNKISNGLLIYINTYINYFIIFLDF